MKKPSRTYVDTSVIGGVFDEKFKEHSLQFFRYVHNGHFETVISTLVRDEIEEAPVHVKEFFTELRKKSEPVYISKEALFLQQAYLDAGIVHPKRENDALHVAMATVLSCNMIVNWNFKHIVNFQKIPLYNAIN